nr:hypothetical protein BaRGS_007486 [Batillaria attramentaria]
MVEVLPTDRLTRKRNTNLQKQLELTLQILSEEYRQTKERLYKDERECGQFLQLLIQTPMTTHRSNVLLQRASTLTLPDPGQGTGHMVEGTGHTVEGTGHMVEGTGEGTGRENEDTVLQETGSRFGKNAYTQEDRVSHDQILNKFNNIFDPNTRPKKVNLTPNATPIVVIDPGHEDGAFTNSTGHAQSVVNGINDAGHHFGPDVKKTAASRRVVWSAQPAKRRVGVVSAPNSAREASDVTHNPDFVNKLLHAGEKQGEKKRPKTAPPKYELIVRSMPAPRQTVVGILAQIENRKADMRAMLNTSKELQKSIKKLVPREKLIETEDSD